MDTDGLIRAGGIRPRLAFAETIFIEISSFPRVIGAAEEAITFRIEPNVSGDLLPVVTEDHDVDLLVLAPSAIIHAPRNDFSPLRTNAGRPINGPAYFLGLLVHPLLARLRMGRIDRL
jgi:hypothetical protein